MVVAIDILTGVDLGLCRAPAPDISTSVSVRASSDGAVSSSDGAVHTNSDALALQFLANGDDSVSTL